MLAAYWVACAPAKFTKEYESPVCGDTSTNLCVSGDGTFNKTVTARAKIDILFVNDNSGSMSPEQTEMANRMSSFLGAIAQYDYRIGVTTTDVSGSGPLQDGNLINNKILTRSSTQAEFDLLIKRQETVTCENYLRSTNSFYQQHGYRPSEDMEANCPSGDERGIYAAYRFVEKNPSSFIRTGSDNNTHLAIVILADEDVRSGQYLNNIKPLADKDRPENLIAKVGSKFGSKGLSIHSIVVQDNACKAQQTNQDGILGISGSIGTLYTQATNLTGGIVGNICANDYGSQLNSIGNNLAARAQDITLPCTNPVEMQVSFSGGQNIGWQVNGRILSFDSPVANGTEITYSGRCL